MNSNKRTIRFTQAGYDDMRNEFNTLNASRAEAVQLLQKAREMGDLSENGAYKVARAKLSSVDRRIRQLNRILHWAEVIQVENKEVAAMGSTVVIEDSIGTKQYLLVGGFESNLDKGRISINSPLGKALVGKRKDDAVQFHAPSGLKIYKVVKVE
ncbi:transcription elongation factor GreA [Candidatus Roizmanbacteria bacterium]|nr:transcription elongation factor GreA [Candidatus Roizmanbacteria bacterium]